MLSDPRLIDSTRARELSTPPASRRVTVDYGARRDAAHGPRVLPTVEKTTAECKVVTPL